MFFGIVFAVTLFTGCGAVVETEQEPIKNHEVKGPKVTEDEAKLVATSRFQVTKVENVELRTLTSVEFSYVPMDAKQLTPIYYVIKGQTTSGITTIFVSSNDTRHAFELK